MSVLRLFESSQHNLPSWKNLNLYLSLSSHSPTTWIRVWIISVWNLKYKTLVAEEIYLSVPKKSNCVKANYLGGPALISHLKIPFVSRLVFLRLSLSNKKYIIKFKCHNIQSTDSDHGPISTLGNCEFRRKKTKDINFIKRENGHMKYKLEIYMSCRTFQVFMKHHLIETGRQLTGAPTGALIVMIC